jgi:hypothetical protein
LTTTNEQTLVPWQVVSDLLTLLDLIEAKQDWQLAGGRLEIMVKHGYTPVIGNPASAVLH